MAHERQLHNVYEGPCEECERLARLGTRAARGISREHYVYRAGFDAGYAAALDDVNEPEPVEPQRDVVDVVGEL